MPNVPLLRLTMQLVEQAATRGEWDQNTWRNECGTAMCFAGWAVKAAGGGYRQQDDGWWEVVMPGNPEVDGLDIDYAATELLGLTRIQAADLFHEENDLSDLRLMVDALSAS